MMGSGIGEKKSHEEILQRATMWLGGVAALLVMPFAVNSVLHQRYVIGFGALGIVAVFILFSSRARQTGRYDPTPITLTLPPAIIIVLYFLVRDQGIIGVLWCYPALVTFYFLLPERAAWVANAVMMIAVGPMAWSVLDGPIAMRVVATLLTLSCFAAIVLHVVRLQQAELEAQALIDPLTGVYNRTLLRSALDDAVLRERRTGSPMTLISIDLDHFKVINDTRGHAAGDAVLRGVGEVLRERCRRTDRIFRIGGEEFLIVLHDSDLDNGLVVADQLRRSIRALPMLPDASVTISSGVAMLEPGESSGAWMRRADAKLYQAKEEGRNRVAA